jgi:hypothetical protein
VFRFFNVNIEKSHWGFGKLPVNREEKRKEELDGGRVFNDYC